ncbi:hypothetical protein G4B85_14580 [Vibrio lentus]|uniref:hypothetical protein n=1 Tax=Vibrio lentus TaxID=136468 RepID=UPI001D04F299|nr:hypothetical protein [Vibrio lentus]MCB5450226.1 hypothetical protein [Vibrio lentus]
MTNISTNTNTNTSSLATIMPSISKLGLPLAYLSDKELDEFPNLWRKRKGGKLSKAALALRAIARNQGIQTNKIRLLADGLSNPSNSIIDMNKKLMNKGLMIIRVEPLGVAPNEDFHHWFLVKAPIQKITVEMSSNDPLYETQ